MIETPCPYGHTFAVRWRADRTPCGTLVVVAPLMHTESPTARIWGGRTLDGGKRIGDVGIDDECR